MTERTCAVDDCDSTPIKRGWCSRHYQRWQKHGNPLTTLQPLRNTPRRVAYQRWANMIRRCTSPTSPGWKWYGARGIKVCQEWLDSFDAYYAHVGDRPFAGASLDRIDNDGNYEPGNVRWATASEQRLNSRKPSRGRARAT